MAATKETESTGQALAALLENCTAGDLADIDQQIEDKQREIDQLEAIRKVIDVRLNGKKKRKLSVRKAGAPSTNGEPMGPELLQQRRRQTAVLLAKQGPLESEAIGKQLDVKDGRTTRGILNCDWFNQNANGSYRLTEVGRKEAGV